MSEQISLNRCINKEAQYLGLKITGLVFGAIFGLIVLMRFAFTISIIGSVIGYFIGAGISVAWFKGYIQRWSYWSLPTQLFFASKYLPGSNVRNYSS